jgi:hypothetical protein
VRPGRLAAGYVLGIVAGLELVAGPRVGRWLRRQWQEARELERLARRLGLDYALAIGRATGWQRGPAETVPETRTGAQT